MGEQRNLACEQAGGEIIAHWDDDDWHAPHRLRYQVEELLRRGAEVCGLNRLLFYDLNSGQAWQYVYPPGQRFWLNGSTLCYRQSFWASHRFANLDVGEDARFVWSGHVEQILVLPDLTFHIGIIHGHNVAPKESSGAYWQPYLAEEIRKLMGDDWDFYRDAETAERRQPTNHFALQDSKEVKTMNDIAVIVTCHEPHLKWLSEAVASINRQMPEPREHVIIFDRCKPLAVNDNRWQFIEGDWGQASGARNAGIAATTAPWLIFWDADNAMPAGYIAAAQHAISMAASDVAIIYPDIQ